MKVNKFILFIYGLRYPLFENAIKWIQKVIYVSIFKCFLRQGLFLIESLMIFFTTTKQSRQTVKFCRWGQNQMAHKSHSCVELELLCNHICVSCYELCVYFAMYFTSGESKILHLSFLVLTLNISDTHI